MASGLFGFWEGQRVGMRLVWVAVALLAAALAIGGLLGYRYYTRMFAPNVVVANDSPVFIHIPTGASYAQALAVILGSGAIADPSAFKWAASRMGYPHSVMPGRYRLADGMSNRQLVGALRAGLQSPARVTFIAFRHPEQMAHRVGRQIEADSAELVAAFSDTQLIEALGFTPQTFLAMFIPNTYELFWNTDVEGFMRRMRREWEAFWTPRRDSLARAMGLSRVEVSTLASILEEETRRAGERPRIAGVYINRLRQGMPLQADPTIKFAVGDFTLRRVLNRHLRVDSPYNTYMHRGLPPGPIVAPSICAIDAVLGYEPHDYLFFCAKPGFTGYHVFSRTLSEHNRHARAYHRWLNQQRIFR